MTALERFNKKYDIQTNQCWIWAGTISSAGFGIFYYRKKHMVAHKASYMLHVSNVLPGMYVLRRCNIKLCVNPRHMYLYTVGTAHGK